MANRVAAILGPDGRPLSAASSNGHSRSHEIRSDPAVQRIAKNLFAQAETYYQGLSNIGMPSMARAMDPFSNHAWVFSSAMLLSVVASQAPPKLMRETEAQLEKRRATALRTRKQWLGPRSGQHRRAVQRHLEKSIWRRVMSRDAEPDFDHPLNDVLLRPNPLQSGRQLFMMTHLWMALRGEILWVLCDEEGRPVGPNKLPERIWPISRDCFEPIREKGSYGPIVGWRLRGPVWSPWANQVVTLSTADVVHHRLSHPINPEAGLSRMTAVAGAIMSDLQIRAHNKSLITHNAVPKCAVDYEGDLTPDERAAWLEQWQDANQGPENANRLAIMSNGFKLTPIGLDPQEMEFDLQRRNNLDEVLAAMGSNKAVLGITDTVNYATALAQDLSYWEKTVFPVLRAEEDVLDAQLLDGEADDLFAQFDLTGVDALRAGIESKVSTAAKMCTDALHVPPRTAYEVVGLEVPEYEGDDKCLVSGMLMQVQFALEPPEPAVAPGGAPAPGGGGADPSKPTGGPGDLPTPVGGADGKGAPAIITRGRREELNARTMRRFIRVQEALEGGMRRVYRRWVTGEREAALRRLDRAPTRMLSGAHVSRKVPDLQVLLPDLKLSAKAAKDLARPIYASSLQEAFNLTIPEIGVPVFDMGDERFLRFFGARESIFAESISKTQYDALSETLRAGLAAGETIPELRMRIGQVYDLSANHWKTLQVARTETAGFVNGVRNEMFGAQGYVEEDWLASDDEATRDDHRVFGEAGPQQRGFNYMTLVAGGGILEFPGDMRAPVGEIVNCRCLKVATR